MRVKSRMIAAMAAMTLVGVAAGCSSDEGSSTDTTVAATAAPGPETTLAPGTSNKTVTPSDLPPSQGFTFPDTDAAAIDTWISTLDQAPTIAAEPGKVFGVDVTDDTGKVLAQIFVYRPDQVLNEAATAELLPIVTQDAATTPGSYGILAGLNYSDGGKYYFVGSNDVSIPDLYMLAVAGNPADLDVAIGAFTFAISQ
jgi:hypothetical protein